MPFRFVILSRITFTLLIGDILIANVDSVDSAEAIDYLRDIKPILRERCFACHGALKQSANLRLDTVNGMRAGGESGAALIAGKPANSLLLERITEADESLRMPPEGPPLTAEQIALISRWIGEGASAPETEKPERDPRDHWAFRSPSRPAIPATVGRSKDAVPRPLDAFILERLQDKSLQPRPRASKEVLLRRVSLDLIGLPPTRQELEAFLQDNSPQAYERVVNRLLNDPRYGQRWGRHWMDVWRYSDWFGRRMVPDVWNSAPQIWRWRDWIVQSLNADKGYDRMVLEMLAADEICPDDAQATLATGYLIRNWYALNPNDWMRNTVEHTGKAFLGLTFNCAHCHDHKYDPIAQDDYFRLRAFFEPMGIRQDRVPGEADPGPFQEYEYSTLRKVQRLGAVRVFDKQPDAPTWFYAGGDERNRDTERGAIPPGVPAFLNESFAGIQPRTLAVQFWYPGTRPDIRETLRDDLRTELTKAETELAAAQEAFPDATAHVEAANATSETDETNTAADGDPEQSVPAMRLKAAAAQHRAAEAQLASLEARIAADNARYGCGASDAAVTESNPDENDRAKELTRNASRLERKAKLLTAKAQVLSARYARALAEAKPEGDASRAKEIQDAATRLANAETALKAAAAAREDVSLDQTYTPLSPQYPRQSTGRRRALAQWIVHPENPLTARVAVNHIWMRHFHAPLVSTVYDFGRNGSKPTHPELLDWLAVEFMESGWSMKHLHRLIVTSAAYQRTSSTGNDTDSKNALAIDPENRLLWRMNAGRMEAEVLRDSLLHCAGQLDSTFGGQELENDEALTTTRRTLYYSCHPEVDGRSKLGALFDAPNPQDCYRRTQSIVPQQALALTNSDFVHELSDDVAVALWHDVESKLDPSDSSDTSNAAKRAFISVAFEAILSRSPSDAERNACERFLDKQSALLGTADSAAADSRESLVRVLLNHNDFVTIR